MKHVWIAVSILALSAGPALATKVTNLDREPHRVQLEAAGTKTLMDVAPNETVYFTAQPNGRLSLLSHAKPKPSNSRVHADGMLSGVFSEERNEGLPADGLDNYVIWPGPHLVLQQRMKTYGHN